MKTKIFGLLLISAFALFSCQKNDDSATTDQAAALLKSATITAADVAVQSASLKLPLKPTFMPVMKESSENLHM